MKPSLGTRYRYPSRIAFDFNDVSSQTPDRVVDQLRRTMGVMQHHDAITGTDKQHVSDDYRQRLSDAMRGCHKLISSAADTLIDRRSQPVIGTGFEVCEHLNVSVCPPLTRKSGLPNALIAVYNPLGWDDLQPWIKLPLYPTKENVDQELAYTLTEYNTGETIPFQIVSLPQVIQNLPERRTLHNKGHSELVFKPNEGLNPAGFTLFALKGEGSNGYG